MASAEDVRLIGGSPCIDFVNTVLWRETDREQDVLRDYPDLLVWARRLRQLSSKEAGALGDRAPRGLLRRWPRTATRSGSGKRSTSPLSVVTASLLLAAAAVMPAAAGQAAAGRLPDAASLPALLALGVLCSGVAFQLYYVLVSEVGAARASLNTYLSPALAVAFGVIVLDELLKGSIAAGLLLVLAGSWLTGGGTPPTAFLVAKASAMRGRRELDHRAARAVRAPQTLSSQ